MHWSGVPDTHRAIEAVWRIVRDVGLVEDLVQDALLIALEQWPESDIPNKPGAWLMTTAKHRAIDRIRRKVTLECKPAEIGRDLELWQELAEADFDAALDDVGDDFLRLIFTAYHPALSMEARVALTLRLLGGLTTEAPLLNQQRQLASRMGRTEHSRTSCQARDAAARITCPANSMADL